MEAIRKDTRYTYADYTTWGGDTRYELIDGVAYMMSPAPSPAHQDILGEVFGQFRDFLKGKPCKAYIAPFDVRLNADGADDTVVQPDLLVICDRSGLDDKGYKGAPDLIVEILSPSTSGYDRVTKFNKYLEARVREYWIVDPADKSVTVHVLDNGRYMTAAYSDTDTVPVHVLPGCAIAMPDVFAQI